MNDKSLDQRSKELDQKLQENPIDQSIAVLIEGAKKQRRQIIILSVSLVLDVLLTLGLGLLFNQTHQNTMATQNNSATIVANCEVGNEFRRTEAALWEHVLSLQPVMTNLTPEQQVRRDKTVSDFKNYLATTFAPRDCSNIIKK